MNRRFCSVGQYRGPGNKELIILRIGGAGDTDPRLGVNRLFVHDLTGYEYLKAIVPCAEMRNARSFADRSFSVSNSEYLSEENFRRIRGIIAEEVSGRS